MTRWARVPKLALEAQLGARAWRVLVAISLHADQNGRAFPSLARIGELTAIDRRGLDREIKILVHAGILDVQRRFRRGSGEAISNLYTVLGLSPLNPTTAPERASCRLPIGIAPPDDTVSPGLATGIASGDDRTESRTKEPTEQGTKAASPCIFFENAIDHLGAVRLGVERGAPIEGERDEAFANEKLGPAQTRVTDWARYDDEVKRRKREKLLSNVTAWAGGKFEGQAREEAWEVLDIAMQAGSSAATPREIRKTVDQLITLYRADRGDRTAIGSLKGKASSRRRVRPPDLPEASRDDPP
jgi:hypothetical protein